MNLTFRRKGIPKWLIRQFLLIVSVFFGSLALFTFLLNIKRGETTTRTGGATLPIVSMMACGRQVESLPAYLSPMDACYMRDAVIPLEESRVLPIRIETFGNKVEEASYEIRSLDTERKIAETLITDIPAEENGIVTLMPELENLLSDGGEYLFTLTLQVSDRPLYFYTRIIMPKDAHVAEILAFADDFRKKALAHDAEPLAPYLEPAPDAALTDNSGLADVSINSTAAEVAWGGFVGNEANTATVCFNEVSNDYCALTFEYRMSDGAKEYDVEEYFKVRYGTARLFLLDYQRRMTERFTPGSDRVDGNRLTLGVVPRDYDYLANDTGLIAAFSQNGELFEYNALKGTITTVFSFTPDGSLPDGRTLREEHAIKILSIDENGTIVFVVLGYMNSGTHEGRCGIDVMRYDGVTGAVTEQAFIASERSFQVLKANFSELIYRSSNDDFYIMADGSFVHVDLDSLKVDILTEALPSADYAVSASRRYLALPGGVLSGGAFGVSAAKDQDGGRTGEIVVLDLESGTGRVISPPEGEFLRPLAFMEDDLVYGQARTADVYETAAGATVYPMYRLSIVPVSSAGENALLNYEKPDIYVTGLLKTDNSMLTLFRAKKREDGSFISVEDDTVRASDVKANRAVSLERRTVEGIGEVAYLVMGSTPPTDTSIAIARAPVVLLAKDEIINIETSDVLDQYFVYVGSRIVLSSGDVSEAVKVADKELGIVIDNSQNTIWRRGRGSYADNSTALHRNDYADEKAAALSVMLSASGQNVDVSSMLGSGMSVSNIASSVLRDRKVLNFYGISLSQALYYVDRKEVVYAEYIDTDGTRRYTVITGFDPKNVILFEPSTGKTRRMGQNDAAEAFAAGGGIFVTCVPSP